MEIIAFIHDEEVIEKILKHLNRWDPPRAPPSGESVLETVIDDDPFADIPDHDPYADDTDWDNIP